MFIPRKMTPATTAFTSAHEAGSPEEAARLAAAYHPLIRQFHFFADLYPEGSLVILEAPDEKMLQKMTDTMNRLIAGSPES